jgi:hypothetical protein
MFRVLVFATMELLQEDPPCDVNVILTKELTPLALSSITIDQSYLVPIINVLEEVDNSRESHSVEEDEGSISKLETHMMLPPRVITKATWFKNYYPYKHMRVLT